MMFLWNWFCRLWNSLNQLGASKASAIYVSPEDAEYSIFHDNDDLSEPYKEDPFVESLVQIKREIEGKIIPDDKTQKLIDVTFKTILPQLFRKNFFNGEKEIYIHDSSYENLSSEIFGKAIPHIINRLKDMNVSARTSSNMIMVNHQDLVTAIDHHELQSLKDNVTPPNSVGVYR